MELLRLLGALTEAPGPEQARLAAVAGLPPPPVAAAHTALFRFQLPPYASLYLGREGMLGGEARDGVAGFWRALGASPPSEPDHLATLLAAYASLIERADAVPSSPWRATRHAFYWEHIASWAFAYLGRVGEVGEPFHAAWRDVLADALVDEAEVIGPPVALPAPLAAAPGADEKLDDDLPAWLLAPVRSGVIVTRHDLARCARELGLGMRQGERRFVLRWLLQQDADAVLAWLGAEAVRQAALPAPRSAALRLVLDHWRARARATASALRRTAAGGAPVAASPG
jgi:TorA maturation chaperone TorD